MDATLVYATVLALSVSSIANTNKIWACAQIIASGIISKYHNPGKPGHAVRLHMHHMSHGST